MGSGKKGERNVRVVEGWEDEREGVPVVFWTAARLPGKTELIEYKVMFAFRFTNNRLLLNRFQMTTNNKHIQLLSLSKALQEELIGEVSFIAKLSELILGEGRIGVWGGLWRNITFDPPPPSFHPFLPLSHMVGLRRREENTHIGTLLFFHVSPDC